MFGFGVNALEWHVSVLLSNRKQVNDRYYCCADRWFAQLVRSYRSYLSPHDKECGGSHRGPNRHVIAQTVPGIQTPVGNTPATYRSPTPNDQMMIAIAGGSMWVRPWA